MQIAHLIEHGGAKEQTDNILWAIRQIGGISKYRIADEGTLSEWNDLPAWIRRQIFRDTSTQDADEVVAQLHGFGFHNIESGDELLVFLRDPRRVKLNSHDANLVDELEANIKILGDEIERLKRENERLKSDLGIDFNPEEIEKTGDNIRAKYLEGFWAGIRAIASIKIQQGEL